MQRLLSSLGVVGIAFAVLGSAASADTPASKRHLVYSFNVGITNDTREATSAIAAVTGRSNSGQASYNGMASDKGEITVDISGVEPDGGLVLTVSETARTNRSAAPVTCVVYSNTNVLCGSGQVNPEETAIIRTLSPKFFDPSALDAKRHWHIEGGNGSVEMDFTVTPQSNGMLTIDGERKETIGGANRGTVSASAKYVYDSAKYMPQSLTEYTTIRQETGPGQFANITTDITAQLVSDSNGG